MIVWKKPKYLIVFSFEQISQTILFDYLSLVDSPPANPQGVLTKIHRGITVVIP